MAASEHDSGGQRPRGARRRSGQEIPGHAGDTGSHAHGGGHGRHTTPMRSDPGADLLRVCRICGSNRTVHRGLCRPCRRAMLGPGLPLGPDPVERPHQASPAPLHSPPWKHRGA